MLLSLLLDTLCGHKLLDSYARGRKNSFVVKAHCYKLPVCLDPLFLSHYGAEVIMPFPFLACFASSLGQGMLCPLSVVQQGSRGHSVLCSYLTPWSKILLSSQMVSLLRRVCV